MRRIIFFLAIGLMSLAVIALAQGMLLLGTGGMSPVVVTGGSTFLQWTGGGNSGAIFNTAQAACPSALTATTCTMILPVATTAKSEIAIGVLTSNIERLYLYCV